MSDKEHSPIEEISTDLNKGIEKLSAINRLTPTPKKSSCDIKKGIWPERCPCCGSHSIKTTHKSFKCLECTFKYPTARAGI